MKLVTAEEMRRIDSTAIGKFGIHGLVLMENAGRHVVDAVCEMLEEKPSARVVVVCGKGNNGGDGFVAARHLLNRGVDVHVVLLVEPAALQGDAAVNYRVARNIGVPMDEQADENAVRMRLSRADIVVDAILGIGISGEVYGIAKAAVEAINDNDAAVVAVDVPSGIHADTGAVLGAAVRADVTVTFGLPKLGLVQFPGAEHCGELRVVDISIPRGPLCSDSIKANLVTAELAAAMLPPRYPSMHKGDAGKLLLVAGSEGMTGAAALCGLGAVRAGAGLVTLACPAGLNDILEAKCTEVMTLPVAQTERRSIAPAARLEVLKFGEGCNAVAIGPGLSQHPDTAQFVRDTIRDIIRPLLLDADGLNCLGGDVGLLSARTRPTVITPHPGELAGLLQTKAESLQEDRVATARHAAEVTRSVVVLKGAATVIAEPEGRVWVNRTGNSGMASGGMGDVLTGIIGAFLAGGAGPVEAAVAGVYYHGLAGDAAAERGARGLIAGDLLEALVEVLPD